MSEVQIGGPDHTVRINHDGTDLGYLIEKAEKLWDSTRPADTAPPAYGFTISPAASLPSDAVKQRGGDFRPVRADADA